MCRERSPGTATIRREEDAHESLGLRRDGPRLGAVEKRGGPRARRPLRGARAARSRRPGAAYRRKRSASRRLRWGRRTKGGRGRERAGAGGPGPGNGGDRAFVPEKRPLPRRRRKSKRPRLAGGEHGSRSQGYGDYANGRGPLPAPSDPDSRRRLPGLLPARRKEPTDHG